MTTASQSAILRRVRASVQKSAFAVVVVAGMVGGCGDTAPVLSCNDDSACSTSSRAGICISHQCAVADPSCPSGYRFFSPAGKTEQCVPEAPDLGAPDMTAADMSVSRDMTSMVDQALSDMTMPPDLSQLPIDMGLDASEPLGTNTWTSQSQPNGIMGTQIFFGIWGSSPSDVWAVGADVVAHYTGGSWALVAAPTTVTLNGVWGSAAADVWAVGNGGTIIHWDGTAWNVATSGTTNNLRCVWGATENDVWVAGRSGTMLHWDGSSWSSVNVGTTAELVSIWGDSASDVYAVGQSVPPLAGVVVHWDGSSWTPTTLSITAGLKAVGGTGPSDVWAAGSPQNDAGGSVMMHLVDSLFTGGGPVWIESSTVTDFIDGFWASGSNDLWAVGGGAIWHLSSDDYTWNKEQTVASTSLDSVWGFGPHDVWVAGFNAGGGVVVRGQ